MKKNFKKSKFVILPVLTIPVFAGVASITGTVAWFAANRIVTITGTNSQAKAEGGSLKIVYTPRVGITADPNLIATADSKTFGVDGYLTHGSYHAQASANGNLYTVPLMKTPLTDIDF